MASVKWKKGKDVHVVEAVAYVRVVLSFDSRPNPISDFDGRRRLSESYSIDRSCCVGAKVSDIICAITAGPLEMHRRVDTRPLAHARNKSVAAAPS